MERGKYIHLTGSLKLIGFALGNRFQCLRRQGVGFFAQQFVVGVAGVKTAIGYQRGIARAKRSHLRQGFLQAFQRVIQRHHTHELIGHHDRGGDGRHQHFAAGYLVGVRVGKNVLQGFLRHHVPVIGSGFVVVHQRFYGNLAGGPVPVRQVAAGFVVAGGTARIFAVATVQGVGFPQRAVRQHIRCLLEHFTHGVVDLFAAGRRASGFHALQRLCQGACAGKGALEFAFQSRGLALGQQAGVILRRLQRIVAAVQRADQHGQHKDAGGNAHRQKSDTVAYRVSKEGHGKNRSRTFGIFFCARGWQNMTGTVVRTRQRLCHDDCAPLPPVMFYGMP